MLIELLQPDGTLREVEDTSVDLLSCDQIQSNYVTMLSSGGSGDEYPCTYLVEFNPYNNVCTTNQPELIIINNHPALVFPKGEDKIAYFECVMPSFGSDGYPASWDAPNQWDGSYYVHVHWTMANGGTATWDIEFENLSGGNLDVDDFGGDISASGTADPYKVEISTAEFVGHVIPGTTVEAKEPFRLRVSRNDSGTNEDAYLLSVAIQWNYIEPKV